MALVPYAGEILKEKPLNLTPYTGEILSELPSKKPEPPPVPEQQGPRVLGPEDTSSDFMRGISNYLPQLQETFGGAQVLAGRLAQKVGAEETGSGLIKRGVENLHKAESKTVTRKTDEFMEALKEGIVPLITDWLPYQIGSGAANFAETLGMMAVGAGVGAATGAGVGALPGAISGAVAKSLAKKGILEAAEKLSKEEAEKLILKEAKKQLLTMGSAAGMGGQAVLHGAGETTSRAVQEAQRNNQTPEDINLGRLVPAAIVHSVADYFVNKIGVDALKIGDKASNSLIAEVAKRIAVTGGKEILPEEIQSVAERFGADLSVADAEALKEYVNTAAAAVGMSVVPGGVGGARNYFSNQFAKAAKEQAEREAADKLKQQQAPATTTTPAVTTPATPTEIAAQAELDSLTTLQNAPPPPPPGAITTTPGTPPGTPPTEAASTEAIVPTETTPPPPPVETKPKLKNAPIPSKVDIQANPIAAATKYIEDLDSTGGKANALPLKQLEKLFGLTIEPGKGFNERAVAAIKQHLAQQGAPNVPTGTVTPPVGESPSVATQPSAGPATEGTTAADTTGVGDVAPSTTATDVGEGTQSAPVENYLDNLPVEKRDPLIKLREKYSRLVEEDELPESALEKVRSRLNELETELGVPLTEKLAGLPSVSNGTDSGGWNFIWHEVPDNQTTGKPRVYEFEGRTVTLSPRTPTFSIFKSITNWAEDFAGRMALARTKEKEEADAAEQERKSNIKLSKNLTLGSYFLKGKNAEETLETAKTSYNAARKEANEQAEMLNEKRSQFIQNEKAAKAALAKAQKEHDDLTDQLDAKTAPLEEQIAEAVRENNAARVNLLGRQLALFEESIRPADEALRQKQNEYKEAVRLLEDHDEENGGEVLLIPEWSEKGKFTAHLKDVYYSHVRNLKSPEENFRAAVALQNHLRFLSNEYGDVESRAVEMRIANNYNENRNTASQAFRLYFPKWAELPNDAKKVYSELIKNHSGLQQDKAFSELAQHLIDERQAQDIETAKKLKAQIKEREKRIVEEGKRKQAQFEEQRGKMPPPIPRVKDHENARAQRALTQRALKAIKEGKIQDLLDALREKVVKNETRNGKLNAALANILHGLNLKTKIRMVESLTGNNGTRADGMYDPVKDEILIARYAFYEDTVLHELVHAATVQVLNKFNKGGAERASLTKEQQQAVQQLYDIMYETKDALGEKFPNAYTNVFEFVSYGMTDQSFKTALQSIKSQGVAEAINAVAEAQKLVSAAPHKVWRAARIIDTLIPVKNKWSEFVKAVAKAVGYTGKAAPPPFLKTLGKHQERLEGGVYGEEERLSLPTSVQPIFEVNYVMEIANAFERIMSVPTGGIELQEQLLAQPQQPPQAPPARVIDLDDDADPNYRRFEEKKIPLATAVKNAFTTKQGFVQLATKFANNRYAAKVWEKARERAGLINFDGPLINAVYTLLTLAPSRGRSIYYKEIAPIASELRASIEEYAKAMNLDVNQVLARLHKIMEVLHNPERSMVKFLLSAPLENNNTSFMVSGRPATAAGVRAAILNQLNRNQNMTRAQALQLRSTLESIVFQTQVDPSGQVTVMRDANGNPLVNTNNVVATGFSPDNIKEVDPSHQTFNMANLDPTSIRNVTTQYLNDPNKVLVDKIISDMRRLNEKTIELDKQSNYWSKPVDNRKNFYDFQNYISFKGKGAHTQTDEMLNFETMKRGGNDFQQIERPMSGRETAGDNPILHAMAYAIQASLRAGRKDVTLAIKNAIEQKLISGRVSRKRSFEERDDPKFIESLPKERTLFHFNEDGSLQVLEINDDALRESIRRTFESTNPLIGAANWLTSKVGATHTRYNFNFAPMNFVRDGLTNAGAIGADMGPKKAAEYLGAMSSLVANGGLLKAMKVAILYDKTDATSQQTLRGLANSDPFIANMVEFIKEGGMVSYLHGLTVKSNFEQLYKEIGRSGILTKVEQLEKFIDVWTDMFELASRSAAYSVAKADAYANNITGDAAKTKAAAYAKNLANFEQVGDWGKALGSLYMFFRPSATGALRAIESIAPAFRTADRAWDSLKAELPENLRQDPATRDRFLDNYNQNRKNAQIMTASLMGLGALAYTMAFMFADDDDDLGRNPVGTDNMQQWTRYARFHVPKVLSEAIGLKDPLVLQMPWGFGLGAFAASGAQLAAAVAGKQSFGDALANIFLQISLDSFVPIPISRMPATEMPGAFILDSIAPSVLRPVFEFVINKNGLGQEIYNDQNRRMGDAYTGGDHIPEIYKEAARWMANNTVGDIDISPNTLYFLSNSYLDGIAKFFEVGNDAALLLSGKKDFKPKTDLPLFGSFFGSRSNVDSREYSAVEKKIEDIEKKIKQFDTDPLMAAKYDIKHPLHRTLVDMYNHDRNQELRDLRHEAKQIRLNTAFDPKDRDAMIKIINMQQNLVKYRLVQIYKAYGVEP